jgi:hypothetical protein
MTWDEAANADMIACIIDGANGDVPVAFVRRYAASEWGISEEDATILEDRDHEHHYETWDEVLAAAEHTDSTGKAWRLHQDDSLFAIRSDIEIDWDSY